MKNLRIPFIILCTLAISALSAHAAQLASAKVLEVTGTVSKYALDGSESALKAGDILVQGDSVSATALSSALLVFSNGSELTIEENTSLTLAKLEQDSFASGQTYEQLQADPSKSQTLLELNYGELNGHVKKLRPGSNFNIETPLGTAAIRGTTFMIKLYYSAERGEYVLVINNKDGLVDIISRYLGDVEYGRGNVADKGYDSSSDEDRADPIPANHTIIIRMHKDDPMFEELFDIIRNLPPTNATPPPPAPPVITPDEAIVVSPELPSAAQN